MGDLARVHIIVEGRVQGVGFRYHIQDAAKKLKLTGWVRNLDEGKVEILAEGDKKALLELVGIARNGPSRSNVIDIKTEWLEPSGGYKYFMIAPSG